MHFSIPMNMKSKDEAWNFALALALGLCATGLQKFHLSVRCPRVWLVQSILRPFECIERELMQQNFQQSFELKIVKQYTALHFENGFP